MEDLHAFFDRDVYVKLACCDLWHETIEALGIDKPFRLASAGSKGCRRVLRGKHHLDPSIRDAAQARLDVLSRTVPVIPEHMIQWAMTSEAYRTLSDSDGIDPGEAGILVIVMYADGINRMITGDKRCLRSMSVDFPEKFKQARPRIITFEECLIAVCEYFGFENVKARLDAARGCDSVLRIALGHSCQADYQSFREVLMSYCGI